MTVNRTTLLDLPLPVTGTESGTWGDTTNNGLTQYMDIAIAGMSNLTSANFTAGAVTIETTEGTSSATNIVATSAQYAGFRVTSLAQNSTITVGNTGTSPARSYRLINADATYSLTFKATGQTGVTLLPGQSAVVAFNGTDYVIVGMVGAGTATDNAVVRFDGTTGKLVQNSVVTIADSTGDVAGVGALTMGGNLTLNGGTANGVLYLNGSKVATSGSALTFDGTNLGVGAAPNNYAGYSLAAIGNTSGGGLQLKTSGAAFTEILASSTEFYQKTVGAATPIWWGINNVEQMRLTSTGLGIGTSSPGEKLTVSATTGTTAKFFNSVSYGSLIGLVSTAAGGKEWQLHSTANGDGTTGGGFFNIVNATDASVPFRLSASGNLGLGVTPSAWASSFKVLQLANGTSLSNNGQTSYYQIGANNYYDGTNYRYIASNYAGFHRFSNAGAYEWHTAPSGTAGNAISFTQAMTLDASGNLGVGETAPSTPLSGARGLVLKGSSDTQIRIQNTNTGSTSSDGFLLSIDASATPLAYVWNYENAALIFGTNNTERARITSGGYFKASNTGTYASVSSGYHELRTDNNTYIAYFTNSNAAPNGTVIEYGGAAPNGTGNLFLYCGDTGGERASVRSNGGLANYSGNNVNLSDRREKTNFAPAKSYLNTICAIPVQTFNYIDQNMEDDPGTTLGVVAQDVQAVAPELVSESNWGTEENPKMRLSIYQTDLQYALMKCIQEQQALITSLTARVAALEGTQP